MSTEKKPQFFGHESQLDIKRQANHSHDDSVPDPGYLREGLNLNPKWGRGPIIRRKFPENCMEMKKIGPRGGFQNLSV